MPWDSLRAPALSGADREERKERERFKGGCRYGAWFFVLFSSSGSGVVEDNSFLQQYETRVVGFPQSALSKSRQVHFE